MLGSKLLTLSAASVITIAALGVVAAPAWGGPKPVVVTAPAPDPDTISRNVSYRDLNLASQEGENMLKSRVRFAASDICDEVLGSSPLFHTELACRRDARDSAEPQIARAVQRARDIAVTGHSSIAAAAITINIK